MKGISTLLATILLIAFTLAVAVIIGSWLTSMTSQQSSNVGGQANQTVTCSKGVITIVSIPSSTQVIIQNAGQIDLSGNFSLSCGANINFPSSTVNLPKGGMVTLTGTACTTAGSKIRVSSSVCPQVYTECTYGTNCPT